jgi:hypothetical protein
MHISPLEVERAPLSRVRRWIYFWDEQTMYDSYRAQEAAWQATHPNERMH